MPSAWLLTKSALVIFSLLWFHINSRIAYFCKKKIHQNFDRDCTEFIDCFSSVQFSCSVIYDSLQPHGLQHARLSVHHQLPELAQTHVH